MADEEENEKLVRAFYEATVPGHRESLRGIQAPHVIYDLPEGMPIGCGHFEGLQDVLERFLTSFYGALDVRFVAEEFIAAGDEVVGSVVSKEKLEKQPCPSMCLSPTSGQSGKGISNDCVLSPTQQC
jgi:ketosteroid isomerase-like protein